MEQLKWTGKRFVNIDNAVEIEVIQPGEESSRHYHQALEIGEYDRLNETTGVRIKTTAPADGAYSEYGTSAHETISWAEESRAFLTALDYGILYAEDRTLNQEWKAKIEEWEKENPQVQPAGDIPF